MPTRLCFKSHAWLWKVRPQHRTLDPRRCLLLQTAMRLARVEPLGWLEPLLDPSAHKPAPRKRNWQARNLKLRPSDCISKIRPPSEALGLLILTLPGMILLRILLFGSTKVCATLQVALQSSTAPAICSGRLVGRSTTLHIQKAEKSRVPWIHCASVPEQVGANIWLSDDARCQLKHTVLQT